MGALPFLMTTMTNTGSTTALSLQLDPPRFTVDVEDDTLELWSFRLPVSFPLSALKGVEVSLTGGVTKILTSTVDGKEYRLEPGDKEDTESFRVLIPKGDDGTDKDGSSSTSSSSEDDDEDDEDEKKDSARTIPKMVPLKKSFAKHFSVLADVPPMTETQVAPREGPPPQDATSMRHAYSSIPQRTGLKRRWMPLGVVCVVPPTNPMEGEDQVQLTRTAPTAAASSTKTNHKGRSDSVASISTHRETRLADQATSDSPSKKRIKTDEIPSPDSDASSDVVDEKLSKSERKAKKAEKKAAKKAKKEAKKAKKAAKKVKKES